jgi:hypothetical protein
VAESWAVFRLPGGRSAVRASRTAPTFGSAIEVDAVERDGGITKFDVRWRNSSNEAVPQAAARYQLSDSHVSVERSINGGPVLKSQLPTPPGLIVSPLLRIFQGPVIRRVAETGRGERVPVLVPWILDPKDDKRLLTPLIDHRSASRVGPVSIEVNGQRIEAQRYSYIGGHYDDSAEFYLDENAVLLRYVFRENEDKVWDVQLSTFEPAPERTPHG